MSKLRAGVIGAGAFATFHARKYASLDSVDLVGVYDPSAAAAQTLAETLKVRAFTDLDELLDAVEIVTVASPAVYHADGVRAALRAGRHVYVEKPIAIDRDNAAAILKEAETKGLVVAVGHQERVVFEAMGLLDIPEQPTRLEAVRLGTPSTRNLDVSATLDLMIHDIDLALTLISGEISDVAATGNDDAARAQLSFANGATACFEVSRIAPERKRTMKLVYPSGEVEINFLTREFRNATPFTLNADFTETPAGKDPLGASVTAFIDAVNGASPRPLVTGVEAARALDAALRVEEAR